MAPEGRHRPQAECPVGPERPLWHRRPGRPQGVPRRPPAEQRSPRRLPRLAEQRFRRRPPRLAEQRFQRRPPQPAEQPFPKRRPRVAALGPVAPRPLADPLLVEALPQPVEALRPGELWAARAESLDRQAPQDQRARQAQQGQPARPDRAAEARQAQQARQRRAASRRDIPRRPRTTTPSANRRLCPAASVPAAALGQSVSNVTSEARPGTTP